MLETVKTVALFLVVVLGIVALSIATLPVWLSTSFSIALFVYVVSVGYERFVKRKL